MYDPKSQKIVINRDVLVDEAKWGNWDDQPKKSSAILTLNDVESCSHHQEPKVPPQRPQRQRQRQAPQRFNDYKVWHDSTITADGDLLHLALLTETEPVIFNEEIKSEKWLAAMEEELSSIEKNKTWELCTLPQNKRPIDVKWVFKIKVKPDGYIAKYKARLVARGFLQQPGVDYQEVFAPVARIETIRLVTAMPVIEDGGFTS